MKDCCLNEGLKDDNKCPACGNGGQAVKSATIKNMIKSDILNAFEEDKFENYYLCLNEDCYAAYYNTVTKRIISTSDVKAPIWFKKGASPKYACYCSKVTEQDIIDAVLKEMAGTVAEVIKITGAMKNSNCLINNPSGRCCHNAVKEAFKKAMSSKNGND